MTTFGQLPRLAGIVATIARYRLDAIIDGFEPPRALRLLRAVLPKPSADVAALPRGARLRAALIDAGPIFVKFGQILSTRRDLLPADVADELALLQDRVPPFPGEQARAAVEAALGAPVASAFANFDTTPLASASIAQVHAARLRTGEEVVVKVLRPGIQQRIRADIALLRALGELAQRWHPAADKIRPRDIVAEIETTLENELDLQREAANASLLKRNFAAGDDVYIPKVYWDQTRESVLTLERVRGIAVDDLKALDAAGIDRVALAEKGVRLFYTQVFRDNFFHADAHPGNIWVDPARKQNPRFIALDFGIVGSLPDADQFWLAENFMALFDRDYRRIAELHVAAGWIPKTARIDELEAAVRTVCEPYFTRPLSEISLGEVVAKLFSVARRYQLTVQPQLILLQKTLLNIEGVGRLLHPQIDIWAVARPVLAGILRKRYGVRHAWKQVRKRLPEWLAAVPDLPDLVHSTLQRAAAGELTLQAQTAALEQNERLARMQRRQLAVLPLAAASLVSAALLYAFDTRGALWAHVPVSAWIALAVSAITFFIAWRRAR
ncbi:MAG: ubiquinone biosynthesis regulatory protein kinase UbiB [Proteobacteria bacterium]|uniref:ubiquinone biosynthesis regulatory protein kinase UbiB n=1 Tax=Rudaea sp. TaxID=2136325 RepID=UPI003784DCF5|nr:ubiquinone biosynthesis regulatory protein kinase UbiB [Pseudomonadota bacterium]